MFFKIPGSSMIWGWVNNEKLFTFVRTISWTNYLISVRESLQFSNYRSGNETVVVKLVSQDVCVHLYGNKGMVIITQ